MRAACLLCVCVLSPPISLPRVSLLRLPLSLSLSACKCVRLCVVVSPPPELDQNPPPRLTVLSRLFAMCSGFPRCNVETFGNGPTSAFSLARSKWSQKSITHASCTRRSAPSRPTASAPCRVNHADLINALCGRRQVDGVLVRAARRALPLTLGVPSRQSTEPAAVGVHSEQPPPFHSGSGTALTSPSAQMPVRRPSLLSSSNGTADKRETRRTSFVPGSQVRDVAAQKQQPVCTADLPASDFCER